MITNGFLEAPTHPFPKPASRLHIHPPVYRVSLLPSLNLSLPGPGGRDIYVGPLLPFVPSLTHVPGRVCHVRVARAASVPRRVVASRPVPR